jgi:hypothetical protein
MIPPGRFFAQKVAGRLVLGLAVLVPQIAETQGTGSTHGQVLTPGDRLVPDAPPSSVDPNGSLPGLVHFGLRENALVVVPVMLGSEGPFDFVVDTGTETSLIDSALARRLSLVSKQSIPLDTPNGQQAASAYILPRLSVGSVEARNVEVLGADLRDVAGKGSPIRGVVGEDILVQFNLLLDYRHKVIAFYAKSNQAPPISGKRVAISIAHGCPFVEAHLSDGRVIQLFLDSGANSLILHNIDPSEFLQCPIASCFATLRTAAATSTVVQGRIVGLRVGDLQLPDLTAAFSSQSMPGDPANGEIPLSLFGQTYINYSERYAVLHR